MVLSSGIEGKPAASASSIMRITPRKWTFTEGNRAGCKLDIFELGAASECGLTNTFEVFVADDAFEGSTFYEHPIIDDFELIGEVNA